VTTAFPGRCFASGQFGPLSIRPCHGTARAKRSKPARDLSPHGIRYFHGCYSVGDDQLRSVTRRRKRGDRTLAALQSIRAARPGGYRLLVILDNLSASKAPAIRAWTHQANVELCLTPASVSRAKPIEARFGPLRTFGMGNSDHPNTRCWPAGSRLTCGGATPTPVTPTPSAPSAASAPASAASASTAGAGPRRKQHDQARRTSSVSALELPR
jgi:hypothetical protein